MWDAGQLTSRPPAAHPHTLRCNSTGFTIFMRINQHWALSLSVQFSKVCWVHEFAQSFMPDDIELNLKPEDSLKPAPYESCAVEIGKLSQGNPCLVCSSGSSKQFRGGDTGSGLRSQAGPQMLWPRAEI